MQVAYTFILFLSILLIALRLPPYLARIGVPRKDRAIILIGMYLFIGFAAFGLGIVSTLFQWLRVYVTI